MYKNISEKNKFNLKIDNLVCDLNSLFKNHNDDILNLLEQKNIKIRHRKVSLTDALIYKFKYNEVTVLVTESKLLDGSVLYHIGYAKVLDNYTGKDITDMFYDCYSLITNIPIVDY